MYTKNKKITSVELENICCMTYFTIKTSRILLIIWTRKIKRNVLYKNIGEAQRRVYDLQSVLVKWRKSKTTSRPNVQMMKYMRVSSIFIAIFFLKLLMLVTLFFIIVILKIIMYFICHKHVLLKCFKFAFWYTYRKWT